MGCAPSIHVSQSTGVVYCRDDIRESPAGANNTIRAVKNSRTTSLSISEVVSHISATNHQEALPAEARISGSEKGRGSNSSTRGAWTEAETQTQEIQIGMEKGKKHEILFGPMKIYHQPMEILLVFGKDDKQTEVLVKAANQGGYKCKLCFTSESAMEYYYRKQPEVVIIDLRTNIYFEGETLCRNIRATRPSENTVVVGLTKNSIADEEHSVLYLLRAGFNRRMVENLNTVACLNELMMLDYGEVTLQCKIRASSCLFSAMEHVYDGIEIHSVDSEKLEFQYVNPAYEKVTGFWRTELIGSNKNSLLTNYEVPRSESQEGIAKQLSKGNSWEGICLAKRKNGEQYVLNLRIVPVVGSSGKVTHHVLVKRDLTAIQRDAQIQQMHLDLQRMQSSMERGTRDQFDILHNGGNLNRRQSTSTTRIEAPITKVINMLNAVQENSPVNVVQVLEKVIDILRSTELFNPFATDKVEEKGAQNDLVDGLMSTVKRRHSGDSNMKGHLLHRDSGYLTSMTNQVLQLSEAPPEIQAALEIEQTWEFDILRLEKVSNKRPLYYLGLTIFNRFNVCKFLNISEDVLRNWFQLVEANYHISNSYHNSTHAADVLHATACFLLKEPVKNALEPLDEIASLIAAVVHDVDHPGFTNSFLCNAGSELAVLYNDIAVLESHHAALAFKLTARDAKSNILKNLDCDDFKTMRQAIIDMIMATEMKQHFEHLSKFDNNLNKRHIMHDDAGSVSGRGTPESTTSSSHVNPCTPENRTLIRRMIIKCADIANPARPRKLCCEWAYRIAEEYFRQTEEEKRRDLPIVMPVFDRTTCNVPRSQVFFIDYFVIDLYTAWDKFANVPEAIEYINDNYTYWKAEADRVDSEREATKAGKEELDQGREEKL